MDAFEATKTIENGTATFVLKGRLDSNTSSGFEKELQGVFDEKLDLVLDCGGLDYISSAGLRVFLMAYKKTHASGNGFHISNLQPQVREVMDMVGFSDILDIE